MTIKNIEHQIATIRKATEQAMESRETALAFLQSAGIAEAGRPVRGVRKAEYAVATHATAVTEKGAVAGPSETWTVRGHALEGKKRSSGLYGVLSAKRKKSK